MVKSCGGQRESDGVVVPVIGVQQNAPGGKGPDFGRAGGGGKREGMTGTARSNNPGGQSRSVELHRFPPVGQVRELQRKLWAAAKQSEGRRFRALFDRICRVDVLAEAWERVRANRGAAGVDRVTLAGVEEYGVDRLLAELRADLFRGDYRPSPVRRVESPLLANIYLHAFDRAWAERGTGELVGFADDFVVICRSAAQAEHARGKAAALLGGLGLDLHPDKTRVVDLREGQEGFDFLGCHLRARMSGRLWERQRVIRYYLHRWPSVRSMSRARLRIKALTGRHRAGLELKDLIKGLNLFLRGWGNYFRTGNAANKFIALDRHVAWRLKRLLKTKRGRNLRAGQANRWTRTWFHDQGLHQLMGTISYPKAA